MPNLRCHSCDATFTDRKVGRNVCPWCGHIHLRARNQTERTLASAAGRGDSPARTPSLPRVSILEDKE